MRREVSATIILVLIIILLGTEGEAFGRPRSHKNRKSVQTKNECDLGVSPLAERSSTDDRESRTTKTIDIDPYGDCGLVGFGVVQKIPYQGSVGYTSPIDVNFSSACVRCGMCIAVVERINQTLIEAHDLMDSNRWLDDEEADIFLRTSCDDEFRHYGLRAIDGERYIGDSQPGATLVSSNADGHWEINLRKKCHDILDDVGTQKLYRYWREWCNGAPIDFGEILCRGDSGSLRDCRSINGDAKKPDLCRNVYHAGIKVTAELSRS